MKYIKERLIYFSAFVILFTIEVLIALFMHDGFVRPYVGDVIVVMLIYCALRVAFPTGIRLLPLYVFLFATTVEVLQYFDFVSLLGLGDITIAKIMLGSTFSFPDILCYLLGCLIVGAGEYFRK